MPKRGNRLTTEQLVAEAEIRQLVARFTDAANRADYDLFRTVWTDTAVWEFKAPMAMIAHGADEIVESLRKLLGPREFFVHLVHDGIIEVATETAKARWYIREMARNKDGKVFYQNVGLYQDEIVKTAEGWRFAKRSYHYIWLNEEPFGGRAIPLDASL